MPLSSLAGAVGWGNVGMIGAEFLQQSFRRLGERGANVLSADKSPLFGPIKKPRWFVRRSLSGIEICLF